MSTQYLRQDADARFRIRIRDAAGAQLDPRGLNCTITLYTSRGDRRPFSFGRQGVQQGVVFDGNDILLHVDRPPFPAGKLYVQADAQVDDANFPDEVRDLSTGETVTNITVIR